MCLRSYAAAKKGVAFFLALLALQMGLILPHTEWSCSCGINDNHPTDCCCNCPYCVEKRDGMLSYCNIGNPHRHKDTNGPFIESNGCPCGVDRTVVNLPSDSPFLASAKIGPAIISTKPATPPFAFYPVPEVSTPIVPSPG